MKQFIPMDKQSKKAQREFSKTQRNMWQINPVSRVNESRKVYDRNRAKREMKELF